MDFKKQTETQRKSKDIVTLLENNGYDDAIVILRKGSEVGITASDMNSDFAPDMLYYLYNKLEEKLKIMFAVQILGINVGQMVTEVLDDDELRDFLTMGEDKEDED